MRVTEEKELKNWSSQEAVKEDLHTATAALWNNFLFLSELLVSTHRIK